MRRKHDESSATECVPTNKARRVGRGLGPFSGGQLTIIVVTFAALLLFPVGAWASGGSLVTITDPTSANNAQVTPAVNANFGGQLRVNPSNIYGLVNTYAAGGTQNSVGPVPADAFNAIGEPNGDQCGVIATPPAGKALVITEIDAFVEVGVTENVAIYRNGTCAGDPTLITKFVQDGSYAWQLPSGLPIANGNSLSALQGNPSGGVTVHVNGYLVPTASCTGPCGAAG